MFVNYTGLHLGGYHSFLSFEPQATEMQNSSEHFSHRIGCGERVEVSGRLPPLPFPRAQHASCILSRI